MWYITFPYDKHLLFASNLRDFATSFHKYRVLAPYFVIGRFQTGFRAKRPGLSGSVIPTANSQSTDEYLAVSGVLEEVQRELGSRSSGMSSPL